MKISENQELILGPPGCGKTSHILSEIERLMEAGQSSDRIAFVSFTKKAIKEATERAVDRLSVKASALPLFKTIHSLAFNGLGISKKDIVGKEHLREFGDWLGYRFEGTWDESEGIPIGSEMGDTLLFLDNLARVTQRPLKEIWEENYTQCEWYELERFQDAYQDFKSSKMVMDFTDMLYAYISMCDPAHADYVFVDEAQDLSPLQWSVLNHAFSHVKKTTIAGDDDQCQPAGTEVYTSRGKVAIEDLDPAKDELISYSSGDACVYGVRNGGYSFEKSVRPFTGRLHRITCGEFSSEYTPNHKCIVKWTDERLKYLRYTVYLMRKGNDYRIGMCELWRGGALRLATRTKVEGADGAWILGIYHDREDARLYEQVFSHKYAIPQMCFGGDATHIELIKRFYSLVNTKENAKKLLDDLNLYIDYPLIDYIKNPVSKYGETSFKTYACNIIPEIMIVPTYDRDSKEINWVKPSVSSREVIEEPVYSLDVEKYHTYVADGIITHNSIYRWSGADVHQFLNLGGEKRVLSQSYRLPKSVHNAAQNLVGRINNRFDKKFSPRDAEGSVDFINHIDHVEYDASQSTMFLVRNTYLTGKIEEYLRRIGIPYVGRMGYSSIRKSHIEAIYAVEKLRKNDKISGKEVKSLYDTMRVGYYLARGFKTKVQELNDREMFSFTDLNQNYGLLDLAPWYDCLQGLGDGIADYYRRVRANGYSLTVQPTCSVNTIHSAKGGEAQHVVLLSDMAYKSYEELIKEPDNERRVSYVGVTRAKEKLTIIQPQSKLYFDYFQEMN